MEDSKKKKDRTAQAYRKIYDIISRDEFPSDTVSERHLDNFYGYNFLPNGKVRFYLDRHPHYFGGVSLGGPSSAFKTETYLYELDLEKKKIIELGKEVDELELNYYQLALENLQWLDNADPADYAKDFKKISTEVEAEEFALKEFNQQEWMEKFEGVEDLPEDFEQRLLKEIKREYVPKMIDLWKDYKLYYENDN